MHSFLHSTCVVRKINNSKCVLAHIPIVVIGTSLSYGMHCVCVTCSLYIRSLMSVITHFTMYVSTYVHIY